MEYKTNYGIIKYHDTPWNTKVLHGKSLEIDSIESGEDNAKNALLEFCSQKSKESYVLITSRIPATLINLKQLYFNCGFIAVEHTLDVSMSGMDLNRISAIANKFPVVVEDYVPEDIADIEEIAALEFNFGRFHEDPFISPTIAKNRNKNWIEDLIHQKSTIKVIRKKNSVVGFMAYSIKEDRAELILGGVKEKYRHLAYGFWANILLGLNGAKEIHTLISSSNIDVLNLYSYFGFRFENPQIGFHKHL
jgi:hypothetical protein